MCFDVCTTAVFPPDPPVATTSRPERRGVVKGASPFGAAKRTLDCEHRSGTPRAIDGRRRGNTLPLVSLERVWFWAAGPTTAQEHTRRLITLIFAGRNRMVMIRRFSFSWSLRCHRLCSPEKHSNPVYAADASLCCFSAPTPMAQMQPNSSRPTAVTIWFLAPTSLEPIVLAHVLVHELARVLQGVARHSETGVMQAHWTLRDYSEMEDKPRGSRRRTPTWSTSAWGRLSPPPV